MITPSGRHEELLSTTQNTDNSQWTGFLKLNTLVKVFTYGWNYLDDYHRLNAHPLFVLFYIKNKT